MVESPPIFGSLTLGGYDAARANGGNSQNITGGLRINDSMAIINIGQISVLNGLSNNNILNKPGNNLSALLDTTLPYFYFPLSICQAFETAFGLQWNSTSQVYTVNTSTHQQLKNSAPSVSFTLFTNDPAPGAINLTMPYSAFDLSAAWPIFSEGTNYFPLRRSSNPNQIVLGRAFMQEAYIFVDYQEGQYTISPASFPSNPNATNIITVKYGQSSGTSNGAAASNAGNVGGISKGAIAGIVVGVLAAMVLLCALAFAIWRSKHPSHVDELSRRQASPSEESNESSEPEKQGWASYSPPTAFKNYKSDQKLQMQQQTPRAMSPIDEKSVGQFGSMNKKDFSRSNTLNHSLKAPSSTSTVSPTEKPQGRVVYNANPWGNSELEDPRSAATAGVGTNSSMGMYSIFDQEKPLPAPPPSHVQELPGSAAAREICASKPWDYEREDGPRRRPGVRRSQSAQGWYGPGRPQQREYFNQSPTNSAPGEVSTLGFGSPTLVQGDTSTTVRTGLSPLERGKFGSKSSLGSSTTATRSPQSKRKHIFELQADEPGSRSRRASERERKRSAAASPTSI